MLGRDVIRVARRVGMDATGLARAELDITDAATIEATLARLRPRAVVNCAAWTDVDGAEQHADRARAVNADGAAHLARAAAGADAPLAHISTDYVLDGNAPCDEAGAPPPHVESHPPPPPSVYGPTKLAGEQGARAPPP